LLPIPLGLKTTILTCTVSRSLILEFSHHIQLLNTAQSCQKDYFQSSVFFFIELCRQYTPYTTTSNSWIWQTGAAALREGLKLISDGGDYGSKNVKEAYGGAHAGLW
jgi:hypothetical protein